MFKPARSITVAIVAAAALLITPVANAASWVDTATAVDQANESLAPLGIQLDRAAAEDFDDAVNTVIDGIDGAVEPYVTAADVDAEGIPNYQYRDDIASQVLGMKQGEVLHRVPGSWFDAPEIPEESRVSESEGRSLYGPGTPIYIDDAVMCTVAVTGTDAQGRKVGITAGHCGNPGDQVRSADSYSVGPSGTVVAKGSNTDYSVIEFGSNADVTRSYNGVTVNELGGASHPGTQLCKVGVATGMTCGVSWASEPQWNWSQVCAMQGDSGAPLMDRGRVVGVVSGGMLPNENLACRTPLQGPLFMPLMSANMDLVLSDIEASGGPGAGFQLAN